MQTPGAPPPDLPLLTATSTEAANTAYDLRLFGSVKLVLLSDDFKLFIPFQKKKKNSAALLLTDA